MRADKLTKNERIAKLTCERDEALAGQIHTCHFASYELNKLSTDLLMWSGLIHHIVRWQKTISSRDDPRRTVQRNHRCAQGGPCAQLQHRNSVQARRSVTMKVKTADLIGPALNWAAAVADKRTILRTLCKDIVVRGRRADGSEIFDDSYSFTPSESWLQGGQIIEREEIGLRRNAPCSRGREWEASPSITAKGAGGKWGYGPTPLIAAMRCLVASRLGDEVDIPEELLK